MLLNEIISCYSGGHPHPQPKLILYLKGQSQAEISKKSVILFWLLNNDHMM